MAELRVNPTRMELKKVQTRYATARRGHKLLKDKRDELMKQFLEVVRENKELRERVEASLAQVHSSFSIASATVSPQMLKEALILPKKEGKLEVSYRNVMSVNVPVYHFQTANEDPTEIYPYGFAQTSGELDDAVDAMSRVFQDMLRLAEMEKTVQLLAEEIEKTRRRVNALEYVKIPEMQANIKYITMKLDENERANTIRLMKVKDMILKEAIEERRAETAKVSG